MGRCDIRLRRAAATADSLRVACQPKLATRCKRERRLAAKRQAFLNDLTDVMGTCDYMLLAVAIRKDQLVARYKYPNDPYDLALLFAMERLVSVLEGAKQTEVTIIAEKRGRTGRTKS